MALGYGRVLHSTYGACFDSSPSGLSRVVLLVVLAICLLSLVISAVFCSLPSYLPLISLFYLSLHISNHFPSKAAQEGYGRSHCPVCLHARHCHMSSLITLTLTLSPDAVVRHGQRQGLPPRSLQRTPRSAFQMPPLQLRGGFPHYLLTLTALVLKMRPKIASSRR